MRIVTAQIVAKRYSDKIAKTAIELNLNGSIETVFVNGDKSDETSLLATIAIHEAGDKFTATSDSKTLDTTGKPVYLKGDVVTRQKQSTEFKSFAGNNKAAEFAQGAAAFGLQLVVQM